MNEINIILELNNKENPYFYKGIATIKDGVIRYKDEDSNVLVDIERNILIKKDKEKIVKIDLNNNIMKIKLDTIELNSSIEVLEIKKENNIFESTYKIDSNEIKLSIKIEY